jgi:putative DNA primase/helicase
MDEGSVLIHEKGLEMVHNIYDEILKTADYMERLDIEKAAILSESVRRRKAFVEAATWVSALRIKTNELDANPLVRRKLRTPCKRKVFYFTA